jgi:hypothetical protein
MMARIGGHTHFQQIATNITKARVWPKSVALIFI